MALEKSEISSANVVGRLPGSDPKLAGENVVLSAHLDHVGIGAPVKGDRIYNGAMDNASGIAALLEVAPALKETQAQPKRRCSSWPSRPKRRACWARATSPRTPDGAPAAIVADINLDMFLPLIPLKS